MCLFKLQTKFRKKEVATTAVFSGDKVGSHFQFFMMPTCPTRSHWNSGQSLKVEFCCLPAKEKIYPVIFLRSTFVMGI